MRDHVASGLTYRELERARRELAGHTRDDPAASAVGRCSCGFATSNYQWMTCHLIEHPGHHEADSYGNWGPEPRP
jgi:hypothetical protein